MSSSTHKKRESLVTEQETLNYIVGNRHLINNNFTTFDYCYLRNKTRWKYRIASPSSSKLWGTMAPASFKALFLASAVSSAALAQEPAWPNWTWQRKVKESGKIMLESTMCTFFLYSLLKNYQIITDKQIQISPSLNVEKKCYNGENCSRLQQQHCLLK